MSKRATGRPVRKEAGVVLLIALIALVAITLAGIALMRSVDTGLVITGNLAFKQTTTQAGDAGTEAAISWLQSVTAETLYDDVPAAGYWSLTKSVPAPCDFNGSTPSTDDDVVWTAGGTANAGCGMVAVPVASDRLPDGYSATYVINRMCNNKGNPNEKGTNCSAYQTSSSSTSPSTKVGGSYGDVGLSGSTQQYYQITTQVIGPRNTQSIVQAIIAF